MSDSPTDEEIYEEIDDHEPDNSLDEEEVLRWLPEIGEISNQEVAEETLDVIVEHMPDYFFTTPASTSGKYHNEDQRGEHGLLLHTKRAFRMFSELCDSLVHRSTTYGWETTAHGQAAILLHDMFKRGLPPEDEHTVGYHDRLAAMYLRDRTDLDEQIVACVDSHNGPWGSGAEPKNVLEEIHHQADMVASRRGVDIDVLNPTEELLDLGVGIHDYIGTPRYNGFESLSDWAACIEGVQYDYNHQNWKVYINTNYGVWSERVKGNDDFELLYLYFDGDVHSLVASEDTAEDLVHELRGVGADVRFRSDFLAEYIDEEVGI